MTEPFAASGKTFALLALAITLLSAPAASAQISWNVTFEDVINTTGLGFDDPTHGATRRSTFASVTEYISSTFSGTAVLDFTLRNSLTGGSGALASSGTLYFSSPNGFSNGILSQHILTGTDPVIDLHDRQARFDFGFNWNSDSPPSPPS